MNFRRPGAGAAAEDFTHQQFNMPFSDPKQLGAVISAARQKLGRVISSAPTTQLRAVISAAHLRLGFVVLTLALLYTAALSHLSSGPTIQLGIVTYLLRLRLGCVSLALTLLYTADQLVFPSGSTIQLGPGFLQPDSDSGVIF